MTEIGDTKTVALLLINHQECRISGSGNSAMRDINGNNEDSTQDGDRDKREKLLANAVAKYGVGGSLYAHRWEELASNSAAQARLEYAEKIRSEEGRVVRSYRRGVGSISPEERRAEKAVRERDRYRDEVLMEKGAGVRHYTNLTNMTEQEKADHQRALAAERKKRQRRKTAP